MKLILSSCDFRNPNSYKIIIENLEKPIEDCRVLYIPNENATYKRIHSDMYTSRLEEFGFSKENIIVFDYYNPDLFFGLDIDVIYISGGNTFKTLSRIRRCKFENEIRRYVESGVVYIGGSAGAHIATTDISHIRGIDSCPATMTDFSGLGLFDAALVCHYSEEREHIYNALSEQGKNAVKLTDDDCIVVRE